MIKIDLHIHSYYSDGEDSPKKIEDIARSKGVSFCSITDHNHIASEASEFRGDDKIKFIQGIEVSSVDRISGQSLHVLGYSMNFDMQKLNNFLKPVVDGYNARARAIINSLNKKFGCSFNFDDIKKEIPAASVSRNVLATKLRFFLNDSITMDEAVKECFVAEYDSWMPDTIEAIKLIHESGGQAVLAHPGYLIKKLDIDELVKRLVAGGLDGLEVFYAAHDSEMKEILRKVVEQYQLFVTGGSDWHGSNFPRSDFGVTIPNNMNLPNFLKN